ISPGADRPQRRSEQCRSSRAMPGERDGTMPSDELDDFLSVSIGKRPQPSSSGMREQSLTGGGVDLDVSINRPHPARRQPRARSVTRTAVEIDRDSQRAAHVRDVIGEADSLLPPLSVAGKMEPHDESVFTYHSGPRIARHGERN